MIQDAQHSIFEMCSQDLYGPELKSTNGDNFTKILQFSKSSLQNIWKISDTSGFEKVVEGKTKTR